MEHNIKEVFLQNVHELHGQSVAEEVEKRISGKYTFNRRTGVLAQVLVENKTEKEKKSFLELVKKNHGEEIAVSFLEKLEKTAAYSWSEYILVLAQVLGEVDDTEESNTSASFMVGCDCCNRKVTVDHTKRTRFWNPK